MTERLHFHFSLSCIGKGNGNPLQCSCLENPRDGGAWWEAVYGVAQSRTRLKRLSSSSSNNCLSLWLWTRHIPCWVSVSSSVEFWGLEVFSLWLHFVTVSSALLVTPFQAESTGFQAYLLKTVSSLHICWVLIIWLNTILGAKGIVVKKIDRFPTCVCRPGQR